MNSDTATVFLGNFITLNPQMPEAEALLTLHGRIACMGSRSDVMRAAPGGKANVVELPHGAVYPGFIDTHSHLSYFATVMDQVHCGLEHGSIAGIQKALRCRAKATPPGAWVLGYGYDDTGMPENRHLNRHDLDKACPEHPVLIQHLSQHFSYANTLALKTLDITAATHVDGGEVVLGPDGKPTGMLSEKANNYALERLPSDTLTCMQEKIQRAIAVYNSLGFTTILEGGLGIYGDQSDAVKIFCMLDKKNELNARLWLQATSRHIDQWLKFGLFGGAGSSHLQFGGFKTFVDGSIQGYTGAMKQGYFDRPQEHGKLVADPEEFAASVLRYHSAGVPVAVHCNGDKAVEIAVQAFEAAQKACPRPELHHIIVHCQTASDAQLERMATIGVYPTLFPHHIYAYGDRHYARFLGPERAERLDPAGSCVRIGLPFGLHVDTPVFPPACLGSMHAAVNRLTSSGRLLGAGQRISVMEALKAYTVYAARLCGCQKDRGMLAPGMFADFVALGENLEQARPETLRDIPVLATVCGGKIVYQNQ